MSTSSAAPIKQSFKLPCRQGQDDTTRQGELRILVSKPPSDGKVERVVIVCHGHDRDADVIFAQADKHCPDKSSTLLVAPYFYNGLDHTKSDLSDHDRSRLLIWKGNEWAEGGPSQSPKGAKISSFEALDGLVEYYEDKQRYPLMKRIIVAGHSLGGQLVQRYSILGDHRCSEGVKLSYVVMNASTFLYLHQDYKYKYGLAGLEQALSQYVPALSPVETLWRRLKDRDVYYLMGTEDRGIGDERPEAMRQGCDRQERFRAWLAFLQQHGVSTTDTSFYVAGVSHDAGQMIGSPHGQHCIFPTST
ncbi:hypothetical protein CBS101457_004797 [Exobasidium rhododendri]|nr:hypothetical protein CBS101457_004797 [Exobasidium rhododendri]